MRRFAVAGLVALLLALPACGSGGTDEAARAAGLTPPDALALISVNLNPSIEQKRNLLSIARRFPGARDKVKGEFDDARDELLSQMLETSGLDYKRDVKPWLGGEAAVAVLPPGDSDTPLFVAMVKCDDEDKARAAITKAAKSGDFTGKYAVVDGFVVISDQEDEAQNQPVLDRITTQAAKKGGLADRAEFTKVVDALHGDRLVLGWADVKGFLGIAEDLGTGAGGFGFLKNFTKNAGTVAVDLHAEKQALVFQGVATASTGTPASGDTVELTKSLPLSTLAALTRFGLDKGVTQAVEAVGGADALNQFEQSFGIDVEQDVLSWMKGEVVLVAGAVREGQQFPDFALVAKPTDKEKAAAGVTKVKDALAAKGFTLEERQVADTTAYVVPEAFTAGIQPAMALFPDRFVVANSPAYLGDLAKEASPALGGSESYRSVVGDDDKTGFQLVVLIDPIREAIERLALTDPDDRAEYERDVKPNLEPLAAFGVRDHRDGNVDRFEMRLTFD